MATLSDAPPSSARILDFNAALTERELEAYLSSDDFDPARRDKVLAGLNSSVEQFVAWLFPAAIITPRAARIGNVHGSPGTSLVVETRGSKRGVWADFADPSVKGGNLIDLYMAAHGVPFRKAMDDLSDWVGHGTKPEVVYQREQAVRKAHRVEKDLGPQKGEWHYTDEDGAIIASVYRFEPDDGGKEFLPWDAVKRRWGNPDVRPLYNLPGILKSRSVIICEGEKAAKALNDLGLTATAVMGGCNSPLDRSDLEPLRNREVIIWPDADEPGRKFAAAFALAVQDIAEAVRIIEPPEAVDVGWDAADAIIEGRDPRSLLGIAVLPSEALPTLPFFWFNDAEPGLEANDFVEGLLTSTAMSVVYGPSNCGKTFFVLDLALHVAWGQAWRGRAVDRGAVVYLSLEGAQGIRNRVVAFRRHYKLGDQQLPFVVMPKPVNLLDDKADVAAVIQLVEYVAQKTGLPVRMVIIDTLSRAMAGGNENSPEDMTALIGNCDRIRDATGSHVCIIHHSGKDEARGARGHSSLRAATDTEIEIKKDEKAKLSNVRVAKQRDLEAGEPFAFKLHGMELGKNRRGKDVTSCVVTQADGAEASAPEGEAISPKEREALGVLVDAINDEAVDLETGELADIGGFVPCAVWKAALLEAGTLNRNNAEVARKQFDRLRKSLFEKNKIRLEGVMVCVSGT